MSVPFLRDVLPSLETFPLLIEVASTLTWMDHIYKCCNPTIAIHRGRLEVVVRTVNYAIDKTTGQYVTPAGIVKTRNFLCDFSTDGALSNVREVHERLPIDGYAGTGAARRRGAARIQGYEDFRLTSVNDERWATATVCDRREDGLCQIVVCQISDEGEIVRSDVQLPVPGRNEKNWMPRGHSFLYDVVTWADYSTQTGKVTLRRYFESPFAPELKGARGGAVDGNLAIVHEVDESSGKRVYTHRFVLYDEKDEIADVSPSFAFQHSGIEFCAGLARYEGKVWLTYGVHDAEAFACCVDEKELLAWAFGEKRLVFPRPVVHRSRFCPFLVLPCAADVAYFDACEGGAPEAPHIAWAESLLAPGEVFVDVGAHVGTWAIYFALRGHPTYAFEAHPEIARMLRAGAALCNVDISVGEYALSDQEGKAVWRNPAHNSFSGGGGSIVCDYHGDTRGHTQVTTSTLDSVEWGERVALLKIDVEGAELEVLRGGFRFLREHRPRILLEVWDRWRGSGPSPRDALFALLDENGYDVRQTTWPEVWVADPRAGAEPKRDDRPRFITTTLTGNSEKVIGDALRSAVAWADAMIVIDTGATDATMKIAETAAGSKFVRRVFPWKNNFAVARNFALDAVTELARERGWTNAWAVTLDTDERFLGSPPAELPAVDHILTADRDRGYTKWRLVKLPAKGRYKGATHEVYSNGGTFETIFSWPFVELAKTPEEIRQKALRDVAILERVTKEEPGEARWWFYLGESLMNVDRHEEAIVAYARCAMQSPWDEEAAWALYQQSVCHVRRGNFHLAIDACARGLAKHPGIPELAWHAGWCCLELRDWHKAIMWAKLALTKTDAPRRGFRYRLGELDGPYSVLKVAYEALGRVDDAREAEQRRTEAEKLRLTGT